MSWFLDTNICIDCLRGKAPLVKQELQDLDPSNVKIPSMVKAELLHGALKSGNPKRNRELVESFLGPFVVVPFDDSSAQHYSQIRSCLEQTGLVIGFNDLIIVSTVMAHDGILVSGNTREFKRIKGLKLENWVEVSAL